MNKIRQQGFTIVEVLLFVSISGLLIATLTVGWTANLNTQRYKDSVTTLQSFLQQQYNLVYNVENTRDSSLTCNGATGKVISGGVGNSRATTNCVLLGRYITVKHTSQGTELQVAAITGRDLESILPVPDNDVKAFQEVNAQRLTTDIGLSESQFTVPWGAEVVTDTMTDPTTPSQDWAIVIIRSPLGGTVHTYVKKTTGGAQPVLVDSDPSSLGMLNDPAVTAETEDAKLCLDPGASFAGVRMAVVIKAKASSQSSVETSAEAGC